MKSHKSSTYFSAFHKRQLNSPYVCKSIGKVLFNLKSAVTVLYLHKDDKAHIHFYVKVAQKEKYPEKRVKAQTHIPKNKYKLQKALQ